MLILNAHCNFLIYFSRLTEKNTVKKIFITALIMIFNFSVFTQESEPLINDNLIIAGQIYNSETKEPLPYANIYIKGSHTGVVSNETGQFSFRNIKIDKEDTIVFQYLGYISQDIPAIKLTDNSSVLLKEEIINLSELLIFGSTPNARKIVKNVLVYKDSNYVKSTNLKQTFIRERNMADLLKMEMDCKKSSIPEIDSDFIELIEDNVPKQTTSYTDFLGNLYFNSVADDSIRFKSDPIRTVSLKEKDIAELERVEEVFEGVIKSTKEDEYWKFKTGIISKKIDMDNSAEDSSAVVIDTTPENIRKTKYFNYRIKYWLRYTSLENDDQWEFLHKTGRYKYTLLGGTRVNGEDVYIIDFEPDNSGMFTGRLFITKDSYALIRADYKYAPGKNGRDIHLFGIGYTETEFEGSIYFERNEDSYDLKYFTYKTGSLASVERSFSLIKKRKRWLFNKKMNEIKIALDFFLDNQESVELLVLDNKTLTQEEFHSFEEAEKMEIIYVDQFDDKLWQGYSIIEPTRQMKDYKKQEASFLK